MALIHSIPQTDATVPDPVRASGNGTLPPSWLRSFDGTTRTDYKLFAPVSYAMQAMHLAAWDEAGIKFATTGRYRSYARQEALFLERFTPGPFDPTVHRTKPSTVRRVWAGKEWFLKRGMAMAATPGTSNHGWGIADDICELDANGNIISLTDRGLTWLRGDAHRFGFALDTWEERWHWHWYRPGHVCELTQDTVDVLRAAGITVPDLSTFGFSVPAPTPPPPPPQPPDEEDDMTTVLLAYSDTRSTGGRRQLWRGDHVECFSLGDPDDKASDAYALVRRDFTSARMAGVYRNPEDGTVITDPDQVPTLTPNQIRLDLGTPRSAI